ncbi:MAG TPA: efflux transporter outer membrane subunit [Edaphobacter sp.]|nr:efflux transporter outer membrane subunit [Edaphobacter sp.]
MSTLRLHAAISSAIAMLLLTGCRVGPKYQVPPATVQAPPVSYKESPTQFADTDGWKVAQPQDAMLHGRWWGVYNDPELNALEDQLNINNQNIKQFFENFMEARNLVVQARAQLYPTLATSPSYQRSRTSSNLTNSSSANTGRQSSIGDLSFSASWEPDLWGKVRNTIREQQYNAQLSAADLENERLTEQASLAIFFFELRGQDALIEIFQNTITADQKSLDYTRAQYETGVGDQISVVEAQNTLQNVQSSATNLAVARAQFEHAIAVLIGTPASGFSIPVKPLLTSAPAIPIGVPSQLLERRPDIAAAERNMASANAQIGIATAAFYPNLTLSAQGGLESSTFKHFLDWPSRFWSIGPSVSETIFDAGLRRATVNQFIAVYNADVASYRQTVLTAFQQVEDNLAAVRILSTQIQQQQAAQQSAEQYVGLAMARYETGIDPYINVVTAQSTLLADQQTLATLHIQQMTASVQLIEALGGGWDNSQLPTAAQVSRKLTRTETTIQK